MSRPETSTIVRIYCFVFCVACLLFVLVPLVGYIFIVTLPGHPLKYFEYKWNRTEKQGDGCARKIGFSLTKVFEQAPEIMALFVLHKLILQTRMRSHQVGLDVWFLVGLFAYFHTTCMRTAKALARLRGCAGSAEPSLVAYVISTIISWAGTFITDRCYSSFCLSLPFYSLCLW